MIFYKIKRTINDIFFSKEPDWYWGLFCLLFSYIMIDYTLNKNVSHIYHSIYYPLPLFEFFHIPDPLPMKMMVEKFLNISLSLSVLFFALKIIFLISLILSILGVFQKIFIFLSFITFFLFKQGWLYGYKASPYPNTQTLFAQNMILMFITVQTLFVIFFLFGYSLLLVHAGPFPFG